MEYSFLGIHRSRLNLCFRRIQKLARGVHMYEDGTGRPGDRPRRMLLGMFFDVTNPKKVDRVGTQRGTVAPCQPPGEAG